MWLLPVLIAAPLICFFVIVPMFGSNCGKKHSDESRSPIKRSSIAISAPDAIIKEANFTKDEIPNWVMNTPSTEPMELHIPKRAAFEKGAVGNVGHMLGAMPAQPYDPRICKLQIYKFQDNCRCEQPLQKLYFSLEENLY